MKSLYKCHRAGSVTLALLLTNLVPVPAVAQPLTEPTAQPALELIVKGDERPVTLVEGASQLAQFTGSAGQVIEITLANPGDTFEFDPYLTLSFGGAILSSDDDSGGGLNSRILLRLPESGLYSLELADLIGRAAQMVVKIREISAVTPEPKSLALGSAGSAFTLGDASPIVLQPGYQYLQRYELFILPDGTDFAGLRQRGQKLRISLSGSSSDHYMEMGFSSPFGYAPVASAGVFGCNNLSYLDVDPLLFDEGQSFESLPVWAQRLRLRTSSYATTASEFTIRVEELPRDAPAPADGCEVVADEEYDFSATDYTRTLDDISTDRAYAIESFTTQMQYLTEEEVRLRLETGQTTFPEFDPSAAGEEAAAAE